MDGDSRHKMQIAVIGLKLRYRATVATHCTVYLRETSVSMADTVIERNAVSQCDQAAFIFCVRDACHRAFAHVITATLFECFFAVPVAKVNFL